MILKKEHNLIDDIYGTDFNNPDIEKLTDLAILCTTNEDCAMINEEILSKMHGVA